MCVTLDVLCDYLTNSFMTSSIVELKDHRTKTEGICDRLLIWLLFNFDFFNVHRYTYIRYLRVTRA